MGHKYDLTSIGTDDDGGQGQSIPNINDDGSAQGDSHGIKASRDKYLIWSQFWLQKVCPFFLFQLLVFKVQGIPFMISLTIERDQARMVVPKYGRISRIKDDDNRDEDDAIDDAIEGNEYLN